MSGQDPQYAAVSYTVRESESDRQRGFHISITPGPHADAIITKQGLLVAQLKQERTRLSHLVEERNFVIEQLVQQLRVYEEQLAHMQASRAVSKPSSANPCSAQSPQSPYYINQQMKQSRQLQPLPQPCLNKQNDPLASLTEQNARLKQQLERTRRKYQRSKQEKKQALQQINEIEMMEIEEEAVHCCEVECQTQEQSLTGGDRQLSNITEEEDGRIGSLEARLLQYEARIHQLEGAAEQLGSQSICIASLQEKQSRMVKQIEGLTQQLAQAKQSLQQRVNARPKQSYNQPYPLLNQKDRLIKQNSLETDENKSQSTTKGEESNKIVTPRKEAGIIGDIDSERKEVQDLQSALKAAQDQNLTLVSSFKELENLADQLAVENNELKQQKEGLSKQMLQNPQYEQEIKELNHRISKLRQEREDQIAQLRQELARLKEDRPVPGTEAEQETMEQFRQRLNKSQIKQRNLIEINQRLINELETTQFEQQVTYLSQVQCQTEDSLSGVLNVQPRVAIHNQQTQRFREEMQEKMDKLRTANEYYELELEQNTRRHQQMLHQQREEQQKLRYFIQELQQKVEKLSTANEYYELQLQQNSSVNQQLLQEQQQEGHKLKRLLQQLQQRIDNLTTANEYLELQLQHNTIQAQKEKQALQQQSKHSEYTIRQLQEEVGRLFSANQSLRASIQQHQDESRNKIQQLNYEIQRLHEAKESAGEDEKPQKESPIKGGFWSKLSEKQREYNLALKKKNQEIQDYVTRLEGLNQENVGYRAQLDSLRAQNQQLKSDKVKILEPPTNQVALQKDKQINRLKTQVQSLLEQIQKMQVTYRQKEAQLVAQAQNLSMRAYNETITVQSLQQSLRALRDTTRQAQAEHDKYKAKVDQDNRQFKQQLLNIQRQRQELQNALIEAQANLGQLKASNEQIQSELQRESAEKTREIDRLASQNTRISIEKEDLLKRLTQKQGSLCQQERPTGEIQNSQLMAQVRDKQEQIAKLAQINKELVKHLQAIQFEQQQVQLCEVECQVEISGPSTSTFGKANLQQQLHRTQQQLINKQTQLVNLGTQLQSKQRSIAELEARIQGLNRMVEETRKESDEVIRGLNIELASSRGHQHHSNDSKGGIRHFVHNQVFLQGQVQSKDGPSEARLHKLRIGGMNQFPLLFADSQESIHPSTHTETTK